MNVRLSAEQLAKWDKLIALRNDVNGVLELARSEKRIGKPLEAAVTLSAKSETAREELRAVEGMNLAELFIVSRCLIADDAEEDADAVTGEGEHVPGLSVAVKEAPGTKCPRCWMHSTEADENGLCPRCAQVVATLEEGI